MCVLGQAQEQRRVAAELRLIWSAHADQLERGLPRRRGWVVVVVVLLLDPWSGFDGAGRGLVSKSQGTPNLTQLLQLGLTSSHCSTSPH